MTSSLKPRSSANPSKPAWPLGFVGGFVALISMSSISWLLAALALLVAVSGGLGDRRLATSGVLVGYGAPWLALSLWGFARGAQPDLAVAVLGFGVVLVVAGAALALAARRDRAS